MWKNWTFIIDKIFDELDLRKETLEAELARQIPDIKITERLETLNHKALSNIIDKGSTLIEFVKVNIFDFHAAKIHNSLKPEHYVVFILHAREQENVYMIDLGEAGPIDQMIKEFKATITGRINKQDNDRHVSILLPSESTINTTNNYGHALRSAIFDPLNLL